MPKYTIKSPTLTYVDWFYEVEAPDEFTALVEFGESPPLATHFALGDTADLLGVDYIIPAVPHSARKLD